MSSITNINNTRSLFKALADRGPLNVAAAARLVCEAGAAGSLACYCLTKTYLLERPFPWTSDRGHAILLPEDSFN